MRFAHLTLAVLSAAALGAPAAARTPARLRLRDAYRLMAASYRTVSVARYERAQRRLRRIRGLPSRAQQRDRFVNHCTTRATTP